MLNAFKNAYEPMLGIFDIAYKYKQINTQTQKKHSNIMD